MSKRGKFIAFEGGEGSGKDENINRLKKKFAGRDDIVFTREPGGTVQGEQLRSFLLTPRERKIDVARELVIFVAARAILIEEVIAPAIDAGKSVISNRYHLSTLAYQIHARERLNYLPLLQEMSSVVVQDFLPDKYLLMDVEPEVGIARVRKRGDGMTSFDAEEISFHHRVRQGYLKHIGDYKHCIIDANQPLEVVWKEVEVEIEGLIGS